MFCDSSIVCTFLPFMFAKSTEICFCGQLTWSVYVVMWSVDMVSYTLTQVFFRFHFTYMHRLKKGLKSSISFRGSILTGQHVKLPMKTLTRINYWRLADIPMRSVVEGTSAIGRRTIITQLLCR